MHHHQIHVSMAVAPFPLPLPVASFALCHLCLPQWCACNAKIGSIQHGQAIGAHRCTEQGGLSTENAADAACAASLLA